MEAKCLFIVPVLPAGRALSQLLPVKPPPKSLHTRVGRPTQRWGQVLVTSSAAFSPTAHPGPTPTISWVTLITQGQPVSHCSVKGWPLRRVTQVLPVWTSPRKPHTDPPSPRTPQRAPQFSELSQVQSFSEKYLVFSC